MTERKYGRLAGLLYLLVVLTGIFSLMYMPMQLFDWSSAANTVDKITAHESFFRAGIFAGLISYTAFLLLPFALYGLFRRVHQPVAVLMVILAAASAPIAFYNITHLLDVLSLVGGARAELLTSGQIEAQVMIALDGYHNGLSAVKLFWGLWLMPFGYLIYRSRYVPRVLGILLMVGCAGYMMIFAQSILAPDMGLPRFISLPGSIGEIGTCLWLLIMGVKIPADGQGA